nr:ubiquitin carboxyl-terminal hydrolase [Theileria orientalis]
MVFFSEHKSPKSSKESSGSVTPDKEKSQIEKGNLSYMLKNYLFISKNGSKTAVCKNEIKFCGLENKFNNCYCNVVIQSLYSYPEFRDRMMEFKKTGIGISSELGKLYSKCVSQPDYQSTKSFLRKICNTNDDFVLGDQQDAHEFLTYLLNVMIDEIREAEENVTKSKTSTHSKSRHKEKKEKRTWLNELVEGSVESETKCHECDSVTRMKEPFITLSLDIFENSNIKKCLDQYCDKEVLSGKNKFFCETCNRYCDASKKILFDVLPPILILHLKRFKYNIKPGSTMCNMYERLQYQVISSNEIELECNRKKRKVEYQLFSVILHIGTSPDYGHYINISELGGKWYRCDDVNILKLTDHHLEIGDETTSGSDASYILFYRVKE